MLFSRVPLLCAGYWVHPTKLGHTFHLIMADAGSFGSSNKKLQNKIQYALVNVNCLSLALSLLEFRHQPLPGLLKPLTQLSTTCLITIRDFQRRTRTLTINKPFPSPSLVPNDSWHPSKVILITTSRSQSTCGSGIAPDGDSASNCCPRRQWKFLTLLVLCIYNRGFYYY